MASLATGKEQAMFFGPVLLILMIVAVVWLVTRARLTPPAPRRSRLDDDLARWVHDGLLSDEQAAAIAAHELLRPATAPRPAEVGGRPHAVRVPPIAEALGYLGGTLGIVGVALLISRFWSDSSTPTRMAISGAAVAAFVFAGAVVHAAADPAFGRLRSFLWLVSSAATALFVGVAAVDVFDLGPLGVSAMCCAAVAVESGVLWWWRDRPLQQALALAATAAFAGTATAAATQTWPAGFAVWIVGALFVAAGLWRVTPAPAVTLAIGGCAAAVGPLVVASDLRAVGLVFGVASTLTLLGIAVVPGPARARSDQITVAVFGVLSMLQVIPSALGHFAGRAGVVTGLVMWSIGAVVLFAARPLRMRLPIVAECLGGIAVIGGAAVTGFQSATFATLFGLATAIALVAIGTTPHRVLWSVFGAAGLLVNVPWAVGHFFPGEGRAPLLIMVSGLVILAVAVFLARIRGRMHDELVETGVEEPKSPALR